MNTTPTPNIILDIWTSWRALPGWVQVWVAVILVPVNMASLLFLSEPMGLWIAFLANIAMMINLLIMIRERGFSKMMALPHLLPWSALLALILLVRPEVGGPFRTYLTLLLVVDTVSLLLDYPDAIKWLRGDRRVVGR
ncbi:MAG: hypothetical protein U1D35_02530 [Paracoccaceae bacterium]|nr:hypothetical protein [Paracoccaceae bacterium]